ncbi:MAG: sugar transferase [Deltaproteobacteria bacterium]|nr:sugar transferase [Deltaproteobacteria bacterium]
MTKIHVRHHTSELMIALRILDALTVGLVLLALLKVHQTGTSFGASLLGVRSMLMTLLCLEAAGLYRPWRGAHLQREIYTVLAGWGLVAAGLLLITVLTGTEDLVPNQVLLQWLVLCPFAIASTHVAGRALLRRIRASGYNKRRAVIAGAGVLGTALAKKFNAAPWAGIELTGFFDDDPAKAGHTFEGYRVLGNLDELASHAAAKETDIVYMALPMRAEARMRRLIEHLNTTSTAVYLVPDIFMFDLLGSRLHYIDGIPVVSLNESPQIGPAGSLKRLEDLLLATFGLIALAPLFLLIALLVKRGSPGPALFGHQRVGQNGRRFTCYKFRTMIPNAGEILQDLLAKDPRAREEWEKDHKLRNDPRITKLGRFLRKTSLDELPQLYNVLRGEMSLVGPRPIVEGEIGKYGVFFRHYSLVRPGLTGLWQVSGRNDVTYDERVRLDVEYAKKWSIWNDFSILFRTFQVVLAREGSY